MIYFFILCFHPLFTTYLSFEKWELDYGISYSSALERQFRKTIWDQNVKIFGSGALSPYTDRTADEKQSFFPSQDDIFVFSNEIKYPYTPFPDSFVKEALSKGVDWRERGAVTVPKNQGPHGYCGTFGRVGVAESQYHLRGGYSLTNFSVEQLVDCVGWANDQFPSFFHTGFERWEDYPFNITKYPDSDPPPCTLNKSEIIPNTTFTNVTTVPPDAGEDQFAAFVFKNGPVQIGIWAEQFSQAEDDHFIRPANCTSKNSINHSVNIVGFGSKDGWGDYWIIKNSWSTIWQDNGYIYLPRGINCGSLTEAGASVFTYGKPSDYYKITSS